MYLHEDKQVFKETIEQVFIKEIIKQLLVIFLDDYVAYNNTIKQMKKIADIIEKFK